MVAKIVFGKDFSGLIYYNEDKVDSGTAFLLDAPGFGCDPQELSMKDKLARFKKQTAHNRIANTNVVHISLNFHPSERISPVRLCAIAERYMEKIGYGDQPYLLYQHTDTNHPHVHIVTTNIRANGNRIATHNSGKDVSNQARMEIEQEFGLVVAAERARLRQDQIQPADIGKAVYGKSQNKATVSAIVRRVIERYHFCSLGEFNSVLAQYNIIADAGKPGSLLAQRGGLIYSMIDEAGNKVGIPIKASSIYERPTLKFLQGHFEKSKNVRKNYRQRMVRLIEDALATGVDLHGLINRLRHAEIELVQRHDTNGRVYGITFIDQANGIVFNGSDLSKGLSAKGIMARLIKINGAMTLYNREFVEGILSGTDYSIGFVAVCKEWKSQGLRILAKPDGIGNFYFWLGHKDTPEANFIPASKKIAAFFGLHFKPALVLPPGNDYPAYLDMLGPGPSILEEGIGQILKTGEQQFDRMVDDFVAAQAEDSYIPSELLWEAKRKRKKKKIRR